MNKALDLLHGLVSEVERKTCCHEETHRGGAIWEICDSCGAKWADDEGGKPEFAWPESVEKAREFLATHHAVEQAGGDERAAFELFVRKHCGMPEHIAVNWDAKFTNDAWEGWQARAALAQPSPAQARSTWPKLEKPAQVGGVRFSAGVSSRLVVEAAQRLYEFESTPEKEAERIERLQAFREQCFEPLGAEFSKVLSENLVELSSDAKPEQADEKPGDSILCYGCFAKGVGPDHFDEAGKCLAAQAEAERPEVVARVVHSNPVVLGQCGPLNANDELMTVAQHAASVARWAEMFNRVEQQRDSALARVAELELGIARIAGDFLPDNCGQAELALDEMRQALHELLAAPPTQAQHSVPEGWRIERSAERIVVMNLKNGAGYAAARDGESGIAESVLYLLAADLLAAAPGKEGV
ncbi:lipocalin/fatty-acid binding family protein [Pseudomonas aeruginosa]|uniref:hypothetical protein n=1 Tax=Pseudomonas aeruginosa TaxID=287 RepID=UPI003D27C33D